MTSPDSIRDPRVPNGALRAVLSALLGLTVWMQVQPAHAENDLDFFENRIRPLFVRRCEACHSTALGKTSGGLALDTRDGWQKGGDQGAPVVPGKPEESLLLRAVRYDADGPQMPPPDKGGRLSDREIADLTEWVRRGAPDPRVATSRIGGMPADAARNWWAFQPRQHPTPPHVRDVDWPRNDLDRFVLAKLEALNLRPVSAADRSTLLRRVTFDLTGLPPTPDELQNFLSDDSPDAFARVVDQLLGSPAYGERWGRHWLDVARYADTAGDGADYPVREARHYRDWVIQAFNADHPFDAFVREQIAGDILAQQGDPADYARRVTATGFLAIGKRYGYSPSPDYQHLDFADVIDSVGRSLLGMSLGCARCHDHKYDPATMADYYALYGILQSTKWAFPGGEEHKRPIHFPPLVPPEEAARRDRAKAAELARLENELARLQRERAALEGKLFAGGVDLAFESQPLEKPPAAPWLAIGPNAVRSEAQSPYAHIHPPGTRGVRMGSGLPTDGIRYVFANKLQAVAGQQIHFTVDFRTVVPPAQSGAEPATKSGAYRFYLGRGVIASLAVECSVTATEFAIRNGAAWEIVRALEPGTWYTLRISLDRAAGTYAGIVGVPGDLTEFRDKKLGGSWDGIIDTFICDATGHVAGPASERDLDNIGLQVEAFAAPGSGPVPPPTAPPDAPERIARLDELLAATTKARDAEMAREPYPVAYGVSEGQPVNARIQKRGEPDQLGDEVPRRFLEVLGGDPLPAEDSGSGRLALADWLTRSTHPLTARVFVNRVWQWHFGRGIVPTPSDFGTRGEPPTHPELLDWLTSEFIASGWSIKALHRLILSSNTYHLANRDDDGNLALDPENRWLWRAARRPLDAESIRDAMLAVSGVLDRSIPASHPFPPVTSWGFTIHQPFHAVYDSRHRSVYLMVQRNRRHPYLALFDAADPNQSVDQRLPTTTPTQTLYLMNSPFVHEQSVWFAERLLSTTSDWGGLDDQRRLELAFLATHGRPATEHETREAAAFLETYQQRSAAQGMSLEAGRAAAWSALARVLLTSNAFLYRD